jgi:hypothetical protein
MSKCEVLATCVFFNTEMAIMPGTTELTKSEYCRKDFERCARYMVFKALGREAVPANLYPSETLRAKEIISQQNRASH